MRLTKDQKEKLLQWVAEGLESGEINRRAALDVPPFKVSKQLVDHYRKTRAASLAEMTQAGEHDALTTGLAIKANRVERLQRLAALLEDDLFGENLWTTDVKAVGPERVYIEKFNQAEVDQYRGVLDDIAKEMGDRRTNVQHSGDKDNPVEVVHFYIPDNGRPHPGRKESG
jgi:hypothetical protein